MSTTDQLAIHGGTPVITPESTPKPDKRWGEAELESLRQALDQPSLFYWKNGATTRMLDKFRKTYPLDHAMPVSSGTASVHVALCAAGIAPGDEVITTSITDMGTVIGILYQQAVPVFADLGAHTYNLDPKDVEAKITPRTKAIIAVHLCGNPCDMDALRGIAASHKLVLIEDCAQAWGAASRGRAVGTMGDFGCYSLNDFKHIGCGDGGIVATNNASYGPLLQRFADKGYDRVTGSHASESLALCYRLSEPQSAVAAAQIDRLPDIAEKRNRLGNLLSELLQNMPGVTPHEVHPDDFCTYWFTMFRIDPEKFTCTRDEFAEALRAEGLAAGAGYIPMPVYQYKVFQDANFFAERWPLREFGLTDMDYTKVFCPESEAILKTAVRLEVKEWMTEDYMRLSAAAVHKVAGHFLKK